MRLELPENPVTWLGEPSPSGNDVHIIAVPEGRPEDAVKEEGLSMLVWRAGHRKAGAGRIPIDSDDDLSGASVARGRDEWPLRDHHRTEDRFIADIPADAVEAILGPR